MSVHACIVLLSILSVASSAPAKISHATVLLPNDASGVFTLSATNGCFQFSTDRPDIISITADETSSCQTAVRVSMNPSFRDLGPQGFGKAIVTAKETSTLAELRSEVLVSSIARLDVVTRIRRLAVNEMEALQVQGYDRFGNTFSSLEGLDFVWSIGDSILTPVPLKSTEFALSSERLRIEELGKQSDILIVMGQHAGKTSISVSYESIRSASVTMSVVEPFRIDPGLVAFPTCGSTILGLKNFQNKQITLPNKAFSFSVPSSMRQTVVVDAQGRVQSLYPSPAQVSVTVTDTRSEDNEETARVCIGEPHGLIIKTDTLFPTTNSVVRLEIQATSRDCDSVPLLLGSDEVNMDIKVSTKSGATYKRVSNSVVEIDVGNVPEKAITVSGILKSITRDNSCAWNTTSTVSESVILTSSLPVSVGEDKILSVPVNQSEVWIELNGGSGTYDVKSNCPSVHIVNKYVVIGHCVNYSTITCTVLDSKNTANHDSFTLEYISVYPHVEIPTVIETFVGYEKPFDEYIVAIAGRRVLFNCSSLVTSMHVSNTSVALAEYYIGTDLKNFCARVRVIPIIPGETTLTLSLSNGTSLAIPVHVSSPFTIEPSMSLHQPQGAVIGINSSLMFQVKGGQLAHLRDTESVIQISHPWVADVVSDKQTNAFRIICRTAGLNVSAHVSHTTSGGIVFDCVDPTAISLISPTNRDSLYIACTEKNFLDLVGIDSKGRRMDNTSMVIKHMEPTNLWAETLSVGIPPMDCNTDMLVSITADLIPSGKFFSTKATVKARDIVRPTIGLTKDPLYLPCTSADSGISAYAIQVTGGSGGYTLLGQDVEQHSSDDVSTIRIGDVGNYAINVPSTECGKEYKMTVSDSRLGGNEFSLIVRIMSVSSVKARINEIEKKKEPVAVVVSHAVTDITIKVTFSDGKSFDSIRDRKWFIISDPAFAWEGGRQVVLQSSSIISPTRTSVSVSSRFVQFIGGPVVVPVIVLNKASLVPKLFDQWIFAPSTTDLTVQDIIVYGADREDLEKNFITTYTVRAEGNISVVEQIDPDSSLIVVRTGPLKTSTGISQVVVDMNAKLTGRTVYTLTQPIEVKKPTGIVINSGRPITIVRNTVISLFVNWIDAASHQPFFPPHQLTVHNCQVKWSMYGSQPGQSIEHKFDQLGTVPVQVKVFCPDLPTMDASISVHVVEDLRIKAIANLLTGASYEGLVWPGRAGPVTPSHESSETVSLSETEKGVITYRSIESVLFTKTLSNRLVVSQEQVLGHIDLIDSNGQKIVFPDNIVVEAGSSRPGVVQAHTEGDSVIIKGLNPGCVSVYVYFRSVDLVGLVNDVCVDSPILPQGPRLVLAGSAHVRFIAGSDVCTVRLVRSPELTIDTLFGFADNIDLSRSATIDVRLKPGKIEDIERVLPPNTVRDMHFARPLSGVWEVEPSTVAAIRAPAKDGEGVFDFRSSKQTVHARVKLGSELHVNIVIDPVGRLEWETKSFALVHKQGHIQTLKFVPLSLSGLNYSVSPLIDQKFNHLCNIDKDEIFSVTAETNIGSLACVFTPIIVGANRPPLSVSVTVIIGSFSETIEIPVENHFHIVTGPYMVPIPLARMHTMEEVVTLQLTNPTDDIENCEISVSSANVMVRAINVTGHFQIVRTSPKGLSDVSVGVQCGLQSMDFVVSYMETPKVIQETFTPIYESIARSSIAFTILSWIVKVLASIGAIAGVGLLFRRGVLRPTLVHKDIKHARYSAPPQFTPHPHPDRDVFITERSSRRVTGKSDG